MDVRLRRSIGRLLVLALVASPLAVLSWAGPAAAATTLVVDQEADESPDPGNQCTAAPDDCSLRQAVDAAVDGDTITFGVNVDPTLTLGQIELTEDLTIDGEGGNTDFDGTEPLLRGTRIDAAHTSRIFDVAAGADLTVSDLLLQRGEDPAGEDGGAVRNAGTLRLERVTVTNSRTTGAGDGGGIWSSGSLTLTDVVFAGVIALANTGPNSAGGDGGAIASTGSLSIDRATFDRNAAGGTDGGGAIAVHGGTATIANATLWGNEAAGGVGGALYVGGSGQASLVSATVANNEAAAGGGVAAVAGAGLDVEATWFQDNVPDTCSGPVAAGADTLVWPADPACPATMTTARAWIATATVPAPSGIGASFAPISRIEQGSPAMDAIPAPGGVCSLGAHADQREIARPFGAGCDIGAFEAIENLFVAFDPNLPAVTRTFADGVERDVPLHAANTGNRTAVGVQVQLTFPPGVTVHSVTPPAGTTYDAGTGIWTVGDLPHGGGVPPLTLRLSRNAPGDHVVTAEISSDQPGTAETGTLTVHEPVDRYAVPGGLAEGDCLTLATGCAIEYAVEQAAQETETIFVASGEHVIAASLGVTNKSVVALDPADRPTIRADISGAMITTSGTVRFADLDIVAADAGLSTSGAANATLERLVVRAARRAVFAGNGSLTIRDSVLEAVGGSSSGQPFHHSLVLAASATVENVTAIGRGTGAILARTNGQTHALHNVIAQDLDGGLDVAADAGATVVLVSSSYGTTGGAGTVTPAGTSGNQTAAPMFVDADAHDFHQAAGSPTIDAGTGTPAPERTDLDGEPRLQGVAVDIGADEAQPEPSVWTGGGDDDLWSNADNWEDGIIPTPNGAVVLPAGPTELATVADVVVALRSLRVEADGYGIAGDGLVDVSGGSFFVDPAATLTLVADVDLPGSFVGSPPQGTVVLAGNHARVDEWHPLGQAPTVVVTGSYPNLAITRCDVRCDVAPGAVLGGLSSLREGRISGTVVGELSGKGSAGNLFIGPADATSGSTAYAGSMHYGTQGTIYVRVFADGTADRVVVAGEVTIGQSGVIWAIGPEAFSGPAPQSIVVVDNDGTDPVGRTLDIPRTVELGGVLYRITLDGGDGNDVALVQADTTGPEITPTINPPTPLGGWHRGTVNVSWTVTDPDGPVTSTTGCDPTTISTDTAVAGTTLTCSATSAGGESSESVTIKRDGTAPTISGSVTPPSPNGSNDWYVTAPTVSFTCGDALSGMHSCPRSSTLGSSDTGQFGQGVAFDVAGNSAFTFVGPLLVDLVDPGVTCSESVTFTVGEEGVVTATVSDEHSGPAVTSVEGDADTSSVGTRSVELTGADVAGNTTTVSCAYSVSDDSAPEVTATVTPATPASGWHTTDVTVTWSVVEDESEIETEGCEPTTVSTDTTELTLTCTATSAGGIGTGTVTIKRDATAPTITGSVSPPSPNGENGWYKGPTGPTVSFTCEDATSGVSTCSTPTPLSSSTTPQSVTGDATDVAGNTSSATVSGLKVDLVDPTLVCAATPTFSVGQAGSVSATVSDEHSGPAASSVIGGVDTSTAGTFTRTLATKDVAGNIGNVTCTYVVDKVATTLFAHPVLVKLTGGISFSYPLGARLTGPGGVPIANQLVQFSIGGRPVCSAMTTTTGWASCGTMTDYLRALLAGGFTATYAETATYRGSTDSAGLFG